MAGFYQQETIALNSLQDISEYTSYLDQRILKLNLLYRSLDMTKKKQQFQQQTKLLPSNHKFYSTAKDTFNRSNLNRSRHQTPSDMESIYTSEYQKKKRYGQTLSVRRPASDLKGEEFTRDRAYQLFSTLNSRKKTQFSRNNNEKLKMYQHIKNEMLGTFYVGGSRELGRNRYGHPPSRNSQGTDALSRIRKGRLWHGRPPVKIVEKG